MVGVAVVVLVGALAGCGGDEVDGNEAAPPGGGLSVCELEAALLANAVEAFVEDVPDDTDVTIADLRDHGEIPDGAGFFYTVADGEVRLTDEGERAECAEPA